MVFCNKHLSNYDFQKRKYLKGKTLKPRNFHKSNVILTLFEEVYSKIILSYAICKCFYLSIFLGNKFIAIVFAIRKDKAKEKARLLACWVEHQSNWS